jgi:hypothetical protein
MKWWLASVAFAVSCVASARADTLLHRQPPGRTFGVTSDTLFRDDSNNANSELIADKFPGPQLPICRAVWWSFYGSSLAQQVEPPPLTETIRIRFYDDAGGLPGTVLWEEPFANPPRLATGFGIATGPGPPEFRYQVDFQHCFAPTVGAPYWIEIAQLGDLGSRFRWENSNTPGEFAVQFPIGTPWHLAASTAQMAYELRTPEPCSGALLLLGLVSCLRRRAR